MAKQVWSHPACRRPVHFSFKVAVRNDNLEIPLRLTLTHWVIERVCYENYMQGKGLLLTTHVCVCAFKMVANGCRVSGQLQRLILTSSKSIIIASHYADSLPRCLLHHQFGSMRIIGFIPVTGSSLPTVAITALQGQPLGSDEADASQGSQWLFDVSEAAG